MANNRHFWRKGEICRVMTLDEIKEELRVKETSLGLWTSDSKYGEFILAFMPIEYKQMGRIGQIINAEYDYYATVEFEDGKRFEVPCMCLKMVEPNISGKCRVIEPTPIDIDDIVDLELNDFSDVSISEEFYSYGIKLEDDVEDNKEETADDMKVASIRTSMLFTKAYLDNLKDSIELMERHLEDLEKELEEYLRK